LALPSRGCLGRWRKDLFRIAQPGAG
jgi:hypothetical protein